MAGLLSSLPLALGLMNIPDVPQGPIQFRWGEQDVPLHGPRAFDVSPPGYAVTGELTNPPSANVEDRRYITSPYNPFMKAADRLGPQGYYMSPQKRREEEKRFLDLLAKHFKDDNDKTTSR